MRPELRARPALLVLVAAVFSFVLVACPGPTQTANVTVGCDGSGCGRTGLLHVWLDDCSGNVLATADMVGVSLAFASPLTVQLKASANVNVANDCVRGFLDVNTNGTLDAGDIASANGQAKVDANDRATFTLDTVVSQPGSGTLFLDVTCSGPACGKSGRLYGQAVAGTAGTALVLGTDFLQSVTLALGTSHRVSISNVPPGNSFGRAFLGSSGTVATGYAIMTSNHGVALTVSSALIPLGSPAAGAAVTLSQIAP